MAGIKMSQAMKTVPQGTQNIEDIYKEQEEARKAQYANDNAFNTENLPFQPAPIEKNVFQVGRIVGNPIPELRTLGCDAKYVLQHNIVNSAGNYKAPVIFRLERDQHGRTLKNPDKSWPFWRWLRGKGGVFDFQFNKNIPKGEEGRIVFHNESHPLFQKYKENRAYANEMFIKSASKDPQEFVLLNFISRTDDWCVQNKKTKVLVSNFYQKESDGDKPAFVDVTPGISVFGVYDNFKNLVETGRLSTIDVAIGKQQKEGNWVYVTGAYSDSTIPAPVQALGRTGNLTPEEMDYELVDFDPLFNESEASYLLKHWGKDMKTWDEDFNTSFHAEIADMAQKETDTKSVHQETVPDSPFNDDIGFDKPETENTNQAEPVSQPETTQPETQPVAKEETPAQPEQATTNQGVGFDFTKWKHFGTLPVDQQELLKRVIVGTDEKWNPIYDKEFLASKDMFSCVNDPHCVFVMGGKPSAWPKEITKCPVCGEDLV